MAKEKINIAEIGTYGRKRLNYLKEANPFFYKQMERDGTLGQHLKEMNEECERREQRLIKAIEKQDQKNGDLPDRNRKPMEWAAHMNMIRYEAEHMVMDDLVYC